MSDLNDYQYRRDGDIGVPDDGRARTAWIVGGIVVVALLALGFYLYSRRPAAETVQTQAVPGAAVPPPATPAAPLGGNPEAVDVPPLPESDPVVRTLVRTMSTHPEVVKWLATDDLIRNFTVVVDNIAHGRTPVKHVQSLKPSGAFAVQGTGDTMQIDPASYARYDDLAAAVNSVDPQAAARVYATLKPRIQEASQELGSPQPFDQTLEQAIVRLLRTPVDAQGQQLQMKGAEGYRYANPDYESLSSAQKLLIRMGPRNARIVQDKLRQIALALGIPAERLPS